jgi:hypothetical protein
MPFGFLVFVVKENADSLVIAYKEQLCFEARGGNEKNSQPFPCPLGLRGFWSAMNLEI